MKIRPYFGLPTVLSILLAGSFALAEEPAKPQDPASDGKKGLELFEKQILPVLVKQCYECHSKEGDSIEGGLELDSPSGMLQGGDSGAMFKAHQVDQSPLLKMLRHEDGIPAMPPEDKLSDDVIAAFARWIELGAPDSRQPSGPTAKQQRLEETKGHWAFIPPKAAEPPSVKDKSWPRDSIIDNFVLARLEAEGLTPAADANRQTLIRRLFFDLTGLPPTPQDVAAFVADQSPAAPQRLVDKLLESPQFGERWGRHWLDVVRYAESSGMEFNFTYPHAWPYRNYVIDSLNADKPFDAFLREQIAGDLLPSSDGELPAAVQARRVAPSMLAFGPKRRCRDGEVVLMVRADATSTNRVLVVDDDQALIDEYMRCLSEDFDPDLGTTTLGDLEKVLFGEETNEKGAAMFDVQSRNQGEAAVDAVTDAIKTGSPYSIVFLDIRMPPGIDGIETARRIRELDANVNIVIVTGSLSLEPEDLGAEIPPSDKIFFFKKPFHAVECRQLAAALCGKWHADLALRRANDVLEQKVWARTEALHKLAYYDPTTGLPNRLKLLDELQLLIDNAGSRDLDTAVILLDIERFSFLNETMGYESGTELLEMIGRRLVSSLDKRYNIDDVVVGRFGADEFACLISSVNGRSEMSDAAEYVKQSIEDPFLIDGRDLYLKASIGVAWHPVHGRDPKSVYRCAEAALHRSMRSPQGGITYYHSEMQNLAMHKFDLQSELRQAIDNNEIIAFFQPQLCLNTGRLAGVEALARWRRPDGSIVLPREFVPLSEEMGSRTCCSKRLCAVSVTLLLAGATPRTGMYPSA